ncbi:MAG: hypothetical protein JWO38_5787 [Gemmataceae bacterium]|nr:hypothetical protein [Gemmataceae bacterium]
MRAWFPALVGLVAAVAVGGCEPAGEPTAKADGVTLVEGRYADFDRVVRENKGSVVAVDFWATRCGPCRERFPHLVDLDSKYADFGLVCISVSLDESEDKDSVLRFLKKQRAKFANFLWTPRTREDGKDFAERYRYGGGIPHMVVFGRNGERVWTSAEERLPPVGVERLIKDELDKKP